jgi:glycosyltransferase involved in cell wall biosynthesis
VGVVELVGPLSAGEVTKMYAETDIFALPSFAEGVPVVLMEAMAMERACVASRIMGIPELIDDGVEGILVRPADAVDTARGIRMLLDDPDLRRRIGQAGRQRVMRDYDIRTNVARLADVLMPQ